jgi:Fic family protein
MRYEPIDIGVLKAAFSKIDPQTVEVWVNSERTGIYTRKLWYLYELLTGKVLDVPDIAPTGYVDLLNAKLQLTGKIVRIKRQRINDNLLGSAGYCPMIRLTDALKASIAEGLDKEAQGIVVESDPVILARAINFLYTSETRSSFAIEGERPSPSRAQRFVAALERAAEFDIGDKAAFIGLQNQIVDGRFAADDWRTIQNYIGQTMRDYSEYVHFVCPTPQDVPQLMRDWIDCARRLQDSAIDAVAVAAVMAFGFVFIHPFEDGNGRIHRFLIHHELARTGFAPSNIIFPVSAVMLRHRGEYDRVLAAYSTSIMPFIEYTLDNQGNMMVENETSDLYRYWDATRFAEYLYRCVAETIRSDLREEIGFLSVFDQALSQLREIVDMPDRRASLLVRLIMQNHGTLSRSKKQKEFPELTDDEVKAIETAIQAIMA